jgi:catechol 2,3-dioxygenase-like lactoylglutathione lyase family enzyme
MALHHVSIRTANIHRSIDFYQLLGYSIEERFSTGYTLACWMTGVQGRLELIEIPQPQAAPDAWGDEHYTGYYHLSFDLTAELAGQPEDQQEGQQDLTDWLAGFRMRHDDRASQGTLPPLTVLLAPEQQAIGDHIYEVLFLADPDGLPLEFIRLMR